jgi:regulator of protease activity HflC (stomatin/prohibitin superfamily)
MLGLLVPLIILIAIAMMIFKIVPEYERAVVLRLGKALPGAKGPGLIILIPIVDRMIKISVRTVTMDIDPQDVITKDNVTLKVNAVVYFRVVDPTKAFVNVENYLYATSQLAQTHLRSSLGEHTFDELLKDREQINAKLQSKLDQNTDPWGIKVVGVEIKHIDLPVDMQRAMAKEAEAERERRAKIIAASGEMEAAAKLKEAADEMSKNEMSLQLRYLQTLNNMSAHSNNSSTIVFPIPMDILKAFNLKKDNA